MQEGEEEEEEEDGPTDRQVELITVLRRSCPAEMRSSSTSKEGTLA